jgi:nicotinamidase-related amidase
MSTLPNRPNTALLIIDLQTGVIATAPHRDTVLANVNTLVAKARSESIPILWVQHADANLVPNTPNWHIALELTPDPSEPLIPKHYGDAFEDTPLESILARLAVGRIILVGAQTDACIRCTLHGAFTRGYDVTLVTDAHTTEDLTAYGAPPPEQVIAHTNLYWSYQTAPGRTAATVPTKDIVFTPPA